MRWGSGNLSILTVRAHAKINLCLEILGKRSDGLHEIATVLQTISLADRLQFTPGDRIALRCRGMETTPDNLILRAAQLLQKTTGASAGCGIVCEKRIPVAAGLGGGSADAAATLETLNHLWGTALGGEELEDLAAQLGADVPFALRGGTALATGTGRTIELLPDAPPHWIVLVPFEAGAAEKTGEMYGRLTAGDFSDGAIVRDQAKAIGQGRVDAGAVVSAFTRPAAGRWPHVASALARFEAAGASAASVTGAGPSVFGLYASRGAAIRGISELRAAGLPARLHRFVGAVPPV